MAITVNNEGQSGVCRWGQAHFKFILRQNALKTPKQTKYFSTSEYEYQQLAGSEFLLYLLQEAEPSKCIISMTPPGKAEA